MKRYLTQSIVTIVLMIISVSSLAQSWRSSLDGGRIGFLVGYGFTGGGDRLSEHITSGRGTALVIGGEYRFNNRFSVQINGSLHSSDILIIDSLARSDKTDTSPNNIDSNGRPLYCNNGSCQQQFEKQANNDAHICFKRTPVELLAHIFISDQLRIGGGIRTIRGATFSNFTGSNTLSDERLGNSNGGVLEAEIFDEQLMGSIKLRVVDDRFQTPTRGTVDATHVGLYFSAYFF